MTEPVPNDANGRKVDDVMHEGRRRDLATAALQTWSERGYAHVSVRNVARRTRFSHGMVHYYFHSKDALVAECVRMIVDARIFAAGNLAASDVTAFSRQLTNAIVGSFRLNRRLHRVRFDLRNQSQFEPCLREYSAEMEREYDERQDEVRQQYEALGWEFDPPFELLAQQVDALVERAVRDELLHGELDAASDRLRNDLLRVLPKSS